MSEARSSGPPRWALRFLHWYCKPVFLESIEGDLYELFELRIQTKGKGSARRRFVWDVFRFFRLKYIKGLENLKGLNQIDMWKNYFKISLRNLWGQRFFTFINTAGLAVGIACCLLIMLFIKHELSYDKFYSDHGRIYRVALNSSGPYTPARLGVQLRADYPQVESYTRVSGLFEMTFVLGDKVIKEPGGIIADSTFFEVFDLKMLEGDVSSALIEPNSVVLTKSLADKYFPEGGAVGQIIRSAGESVKVTGVVTDPPANTHMPFKFIGSMPREEWVTQGWWTGNNFFTYIKLSEGYSKVQMESNMVDFVKKYIGPELIAFSGHATFEDYLAAGNSHFFSLHPMTDIHLHYPRFSLDKGGDINNVYIFASVAFFILLIACINYVNLATARSARRSKEVGVRKVLGALKGELTQQFLVESLIVSLVSAILALCISYLTLPYFNVLAGKSFTLSDLITSQTMLWLTILFVAIGFLAGAYPALMQASMRPVQALRGQFSSGKAGGLLRKGLVSFQFAVSIFLVISTLVVFVQLDFINNQKLGMDISQVVAVRGGNALGEKALYFKDKLKENANVEEIAISNLYPSQPHYDWSFKTVGENPVTFGFSNLFTDDNYQTTLGIELVQGRYFDKSFATDTAAIVINEAAVRELGWTEPLGQKLDRGAEGQFTVIGVVKDYNYYSLKNKVGGLVIRYNPKIYSDYCTYLIRINGNYEATLNEIESLWAELSPEEAFDYTFLNESFATLYESEKRFGQVFTVFAMLAIFIACLGLFALAAFTLERRHKEIAIRKVLGASVTSITTLVLTDFTKLVIAGSIIAVPLAFYLMDLWLQEFAYRMKLVPLLFIMPVLLITLVAWLTVIYQSVRTASSNPVNALKQE